MRSHPTRRFRRIPVLLSLGLSLLSASVGHGSLLVPVSQDRSISGNAFAQDKFGDPIQDSDSEQAPDFGPFDGAAAANANVDTAIGSGGGQQSSTVVGNAVMAQGSLFANAETWEFGAQADASAINRMQVTFEVTAETSYRLEGQLGAFDQALAEISLREGAIEIFGAIVFGPANSLTLDESGTLAPGTFTLEVRLEGNVFGSDFFPAYSSADFDIALLLGADEPGGEVPDGDDVPGSPLRIERLPGGDVRLHWSPSCRAADIDFGVYEGELVDPVGLTPVTCSTAGATQWDLSPRFDGSYFLVVPNDGSTEGSYGDTGSGAERAPSFSACLAHSIGAPTCP